MVGEDLTACSGRGCAACMHGFGGGGRQAGGRRQAGKASRVLAPEEAATQGFTAHSKPIISSPKPQWRNHKLTKGRMKTVPMLKVAKYTCTTQQQQQQHGGGSGRR